MQSVSFTKAFISKTAFKQWKAEAVMTLTSFSCTENLSFCKYLAYLLNLLTPSIKLSAFPLQCIIPLENTKQLPLILLCFQISPGNFSSHRWHCQLHSIAFLNLYDNTNYHYRWRWLNACWWEYEKWTFRKLDLYLSMSRDIFLLDLYSYWTICNSFSSMISHACTHARTHAHTESFHQI